MQPNPENDILNIVREIKKAFADNDGWSEDLEISLEVRDFTEAQKKIIIENATPTSFQDIGAKLSFEQALTHAFKDPAENGAFMIKTLSGEDSLSLQALEKTRRAMEEIINNYPRLLKEDMPGSVQNIIDTLNNNVLPQMKIVISKLEVTTGLKAEDVETAEDWQIIHNLPDDFETPAP